MRTIKSMSAVAALALVLGACGGDDEPSDDAAAPGDATEDPGDDDGADDDDTMTVATDSGVTDEPCPDAVNADNGCIYLGTITDLTGPFAGFGVPLTAAQEAFWARVNAMGGITAEGYDLAYDVDVTTYNQSSGYDATEHARLFEEMEPDILALAQTLGTPMTQAILPAMQAGNVVAAPATYSSLWNFEDTVLESSANYCVETMNSIDYAVDAYDDLSSVMAVGFEGDYGGDAAAAAAIAAEAHGLEFSSVTTPSGQDNQAEAVGQIVAQSPDLVIVSTGPAEAAAIVGGAAQNEFTGRFIGTNPTWNPALLESAAGPALTALFEVGGPFLSWGADTPGHQAMIETLGEPDDLNDGLTIGWIWQYPLKSALEAALANGDLTRAGLLSAGTALESVDYEGTLPEGAGNFAGGPEAQILETQISRPDPEAPTGISTVQEFFTGTTAAEWAPSVCFQDE